jgi:hypothetical protein
MRLKKLTSWREDKAIEMVECTNSTTRWIKFTSEEYDKHKIKIRKR